MAFGETSLDLRNVSIKQGFEEENILLFDEHS